MEVFFIIFMNIRKKEVSGTGEINLGIELFLPGSHQRRQKYNPVIFQG